MTRRFQVPTELSLYTISYCVVSRVIPSLPKKKARNLISRTSSASSSGFSCWAGSVASCSNIPREHHQSNQRWHHHLHLTLHHLLPPPLQSPPHQLYQPSQPRALKAPRKEAPLLAQHDCHFNRQFHIQIQLIVLLVLCVSSWLIRDGENPVLFGLSVISKFDWNQL